MASIINASTSGVGGVITTADNSGDLNIQSGGSTKIAVTSAGANIVGTLTVNGVAPASGKVLQVVQAQTATQVGNNTSTYSDTTLTATITPTSASSKILIIFVQNGLLRYDGNVNNGIAIQLVRNSTSLIVTNTRVGLTGSIEYTAPASSAGTYLDSPATTSATTYKTQFRNNNNSFAVGVQESGISTITLMEIAA